MSRLSQARVLLAGEATPKTRAAKVKIVKRILSPDARQRIALAQKKRGAEVKRAKAHNIRGSSAASRATYLLAHKLEFAGS